VSFTAITLCVASQRVFIVVRFKCDPQLSVISERADLKQQRICVKFCFRLGKTVLKTHEMLRTAFGDDAMERTQTLEAKQVRSNIKSMLVMFFDSEVIVHQEFVPPGQNGEPVLLPGGFEASEGASPPKTSGTMVEPGLVASP
jgi:hypothetical protein